MRCPVVVACFVFAGVCGGGCGVQKAVPATVRQANTETSGYESVTAYREVKYVDGYRIGDNDVDDEHGRDNPDDDYPLTKYGRVADAIDKRSVTALVKRYYAAALAEDGKTACSLMYRGLARNERLAKTVPEDRFSRPVRVHVSPGEHCPSVMRALFRRRHNGLASEAKALRVTAVRVDRAHGMAVVAFKHAPEHWIPVVREDGQWKVHALLALLLP